VECGDGPGEQRQPPGVLVELVDDLTDVEGGEREHRDADEREQRDRAGTREGGGCEGERRRSGDGDKRPRLDVDAQRA
jgi:hypothetical protein